MPYETRLVDGGKGTLRHGSGILTNSELLAACLRFSNEPEETRHIRYMLADFSEVMELQLTPDAIHYAAELNRRSAEISPGMFVAIVAPGPLAYGLSRMWQMLMQDTMWKSAVFHQRAEAIHWLREQLGHGDPNAAILNEFPTLKEESREPAVALRPIVHSEKNGQPLPRSHTAHLP